jgi:two-component system response regulator CpxR
VAVFAFVRRSANRASTIQILKASSFKIGQPAVKKCKQPAKFIYNCSQMVFQVTQAAFRTEPASDFPTVQEKKGRTTCMDRVLIIDDDSELCALVRECLGEEGLFVESVHDGKHGLERSLSGKYDMVVLDVVLPGMGGMHVLQKLRATSHVGVLILSARGNEVDRILGLEYGADDYLPKPFNPRELVARVRAVLRRLKPGAQEYGSWTPEHLELGDVELDKGTRTCRRNGEIIELTTIEFDLLEVLVRGSGRVLPREDLFRTALDRKFSPFDRSVDVHIGHLRRKLGLLPDGTQRIRTVRNVGYLYAQPSIAIAQSKSGHSLQILPGKSFRAVGRR